MYKLANYINTDPKISAFISIVNNLEKEGLISIENHQKILNRIDKNKEWIDKHYHDILVHFGLVQTSTPSSLVTEEPQSTQPSTISVPTTTPNSAVLLTRSLSLIMVCGVLKFISI